MGGRNDQTQPRWWEEALRTDFVPETELTEHLRNLARSSFEHSPTRRAAFLQAAEVIERLQREATQDTPSQELAIHGYPGYPDDFAEAVLVRIRTFHTPAHLAIRAVEIAREMQR